MSEHQKSGLYDASHHKAHNCFQKFCKFCAQELEMIMFLFLWPKERNSQNLNKKRIIFYLNSSMLKISLNKKSFHSWLFFYLFLQKLLRSAKHLASSDILLTPIFPSANWLKKNNNW
jgi:hypothetical protein